MKKEALNNPNEFIESLRNGRIKAPERQRILATPFIHFGKYLKNKEYGINYPFPIKFTTTGDLYSDDTVILGKEIIQNTKQINSQNADNSSEETRKRPWTQEEIKKLSELLVKYPNSNQSSKERFAKIAAELPTRTFSQVTKT